MTSPDELAVLRADYKEWNLWPSDSGHLYATRYKAPPIDVGKFRVFRMVDAVDVPGLRARLADQAERQVRAEAVLGSFG